MLEKHNRHSHLSPQNTADVRAPLSGSPSQTPAYSQRTSTEIPIANLSLGLGIQTPQSSASVQSSGLGSQPWPTRTSSAARSITSPPQSADRSSQHPVNSGSMRRKPVPSSSSAHGVGDMPWSGNSHAWNADERRY